jgi:hypothetical protein
MTWRTIWAGPYLGECVNGLEDLWRIHRDEAALKMVGWTSATLLAASSTTAALETLVRQVARCSLRNPQHIVNPHVSSYLGG